MEPQLFLLDVEIKCFHEDSGFQYQLCPVALGNTSRFVSPIPEPGGQGEQVHRGSTSRWSFWHEELDASPWPSYP